MPAKDLKATKLKRAAGSFLLKFVGSVKNGILGLEFFPLKCINSIKDGNLGPTPNAVASSSFQRGRIYVATSRRRKPRSYGCQYRCL
ncbi:hypothetical protein SLA2020_339620 [Shorea laevis]